MNNPISESTYTQARDNSLKDFKSSKTRWQEFNKPGIWEPVTQTEKTMRRIWENCQLNGPDGQLAGYPGDIVHDLRYIHELARDKKKPTFWGLAANGCGSYSVVDHHSLDKLDTFAIFKIAGPDLSDWEGMNDIAKEMLDDVCLVGSVLSDR